MKSCIAVDIGGTKMLIAEVREDGSIVNMKRYPTGRIGKEAVINNVKKGIREYAEEFGWENGSMPASMGIGLNDIVDPLKGTWRGYRKDDPEVPVVDMMTSEFGVKCYIDNDVKSTVIAENKFGAGKGCRDMTYVNLGTGLAAGVIANGKLVRGSDGFAGEVGFMNFTGGAGPHVELIASGMGLNHQLKTLVKDYPDSLLADKAEGIVSGYEVFDAAEKGDALAEKILDNMVIMAGLLISNLTCVLSPEIVILGGGLISSGKLLQRIIDAVSDKAMQHLEKGIVLTGLDPAYAGLMGAAAIGLGYQEEYL